MRPGEPLRNACNNNASNTQSQKVPAALVRAQVNHGNVMGAHEGTEASAEQ